MARLNGTIHIITGNHCWLQAYEGMDVRPSLTAKYGFWLSHAPIHPNELRGRKNIHGHVHNEAVTYYDEIFEIEAPDPNYINVCCDVTDYKPISLEEIRER